MNIVEYIHEISNFFANITVTHGILNLEMKE